MVTAADRQRGGGGRVNRRREAQRETEIERVTKRGRDRERDGQIEKGITRDTEME